MVHTRRTLAWPLLGLIVALGPAALGPDSAGAATRPAAQDAAASVTHPCALLADAQIKKLAGYAVTTHYAGNGDNPGEHDCLWVLSTKDGSLQVTDEPSYSQSDLTKENGLLGTAAHRVEGVGQVAYLVCSGGNGLPPQCEIRVHGHGTTIDVLLAVPGTAAASSKKVEHVARAVMGEL
jgi:hypothetical protein